MIPGVAERTIAVPCHVISDTEYIRLIGTRYIYECFENGNLSESLSSGWEFACKTLLLSKLGTSKVWSHK